MFLLVHLRVPPATFGGKQTLLSSTKKAAPFFGTPHELNRWFFQGKPLVLNRITWL